MQSTSPTTTSEHYPAGLRHVTILVSELAGFAEWSRRTGDLEAGRVAGRLLALQEIILTRDDAGQVLQTGSDSVLAVFDVASAALNRALEIQRVLDAPPTTDGVTGRPLIRIGLHTGEVLIREGERVEIISRHIHRARSVMEAADPGQILASEAVVEAARDFIEIPPEHLGLQYYGEYYLKGAGAANLCEVADLRFRKPAPPQIPAAGKAEGALIGRLELAGYRIGARLGEGVHGVVYRAEQASTGRPVALKVFSLGTSRQPLARERFGQEMAALRALGWAGMAALVEERLDHAPPFVATELGEGTAVDAALAQAPPARVAKVFQEICVVLSRVHGAGLVHGDLKPGNVLVREDASVVLLDFGMRSFLDPGSTAHFLPGPVLGAPAYLAPETIQGRVCEPRTDLYAVGVLLFKVLTGHEPFEGKSVHEIIQDHLHTDPPLPALLRPGVADGLQRICLKALEKNPADRYGSATEMAGDLQRFLQGEVVRTRPTAYENLLLHRVQQHVRQIREWAARGLLSEEEQHGLLSAYEGLQRRGLPAVMEGRVYRFWQTLVYVGGWAVINGAVLWLVLHWNELGRAGKLLLGSLPAVTACALAAAMWRLERFRLTFVALVVGILAVPLLTGVWLLELEVAARVPEARLSQELFHATVDSEDLTNRQLLIMSLATLAAAGMVMSFTRTTTHSAQTAAAAVFAYSCVLLWFGFKHCWEEEKWAALAARYVPFLLLTGVTANQLLGWPERRYQASPWVYLAAFLVMVLPITLSLRGLEEWTDLPEALWKPASLLLLSLSGAVLTAVGLLARNRLKHRCRPATLAVVFVGLVSLLAGLGAAGWEETWPQTWWRPVLFDAPVPASHLAMPLVSLGITLLACRFQMFTFLLVGLAGFALSIHLLGSLYFEQNNGWPKLLIALGTACFFASLFLELRRTCGNAVDDVVRQSRL